VGGILKVTSQRGHVFGKVPSAGPGPQHIDPFLWLKDLLKTRLKSASIEPLIYLLAHLYPKLWAKNPVFGLIPNFSEKA